MYPLGRAFVKRDDIVGVVVGFIPYLGWISIIFQRMLSTKYLILLIPIALGLVSSIP